MSAELRPPERIVTAEIAKAARRVERLKLRRRALLKKLRVCEDDIRDAGRALRNLVADSTAPHVGEQTTLADADLSTDADRCPTCGLVVGGVDDVVHRDDRSFHARCAS